MIGLGLRPRGGGTGKGKHPRESLKNCKKLITKKPIRGMVLCGGAGGCGIEKSAIRKNWTALPNVAVRPFADIRSLICGQFVVGLLMHRINPSICLNSEIGHPLRPISAHTPGVLPEGRGLCVSSLLGGAACASKRAVPNEEDL